MILSQRSTRKIGNGPEPSFLNLRDKYTQKEGVTMDAREELKRWIATVVQMSAEEESKVIKQDIDLFLAVAGELSGKLADRNASLAKQIRPRSSAKPSKPSPQKAQKQPEVSPSSDDSPASQNAAQDRSQERSGQLSQLQQSQPSPVDQQRAFRGYVYGAQNDEVAFRKAAQAIAR